MKMVDFVRRDNPQVQNFIKSGNQFLTKVWLFIQKSKGKKNISQDGGDAYFKEILHTILFYGNINRPRIEPEEMLGHQFYQLLSRQHPDVFKEYKTRLPTRPPFTVLLDAVVEIMGTTVKDKVLYCLLGLTKQMVLRITDDNSSRCGNVFVSNVINYCYFCDADIKMNATVNYFGASVSCKGREQREIMIDILCCQTWHKDISLAVCIGNEKQENAFSFPPVVTSMAFNIKPPASGATPGNQRDRTVVGSAGDQMPNALEMKRILDESLIPRTPCERCFTMFPDIVYNPPPRHEQPFWEYGNCAECESLSQLLCAEEQIVRKLKFLNSATDRNQLQSLIDSKLTRLRDNLRSLKFNMVHGLLFYDPSGRQSTALRRFQH